MERSANVAAVGSDEKTKTDAKVSELKAKADALREKLKGTETAYKRVAQPYICYNCHKAQQVQLKMASHHPVPEGKMKCSDCHNPHGGPNGMLKDESVNETCAKCHAEKVGPFTFDHPPVAENCTNCHNPHGTVANNLLKQSEPFLCLKCHPGPHSRSAVLGNANKIPNYYTECTDCHSQVHGSDEHAALHY
jgi:DmsE family decaheme c-type cytochrome